MMHSTNGSHHGAQMPSVGAVHIITGFRRRISLVTGFRCRLLPKADVFEEAAAAAALEADHEAVETDRYLDALNRWATARRRSMTSWPWPA